MGGRIGLGLTSSQNESPVCALGPPRPRFLARRPRQGPSSLTGSLAVTELCARDLRGGRREPLPTEAQGMAGGSPRVREAPKTTTRHRSTPWHEKHRNLQRAWEGDHWSSRPSPGKREEKRQEGGFAQFCCAGPALPGVEVGPSAMPAHGSLRLGPSRAGNLLTEVPTASTQALPAGLARARATFILLINNSTSRDLF